MGDRVLIQCHSSKTGEFGPVIYGHWCGDRAADAVKRLRERMKTRGGDLAYSSARMVQELIGDNEGPLSFGVWNAKALLIRTDSHGDAGIILIDVDTDHKAQAIGGYLKDSDLN
jgi:hypothetical protein